MLPTRNPKVIFKALATGAVLYSTEEEVYFGLNPVGVRVWELLPPAHQTLEEVARVIAAEYPDAGEEMIRADVSELIDELPSSGWSSPRWPLSASPERWHRVSPASPRRAAGGRSRPR